ncbi:MAG: hypothetical protein PHN74_02320 [Candidatus Pacebacteria bacterium]|nr:hypothetical protein [Candidatus Paceibacterota bacterium]
MKKILLASLIILPIVAMAQVNVPQTNIKSLSDIERVINSIVTWVSGIFFAIAILFLLWAAFLYLSSGGDEDKVKTAKDNLIYAIIAIAVALLAGTARSIIESVLNR